MTFSHRTFDGHEASINCCMFSPDGAFLISGSSNGDLRIWDALYGTNRNLFLELEAHDLGVTCCDYSPTYGSAGELKTSHHDSIECGLSPFVG